jgi:hypothetical protein
MKRKILTLISALIAWTTVHELRAVPTILDDFNVSEGHFTGVPTASGSTVGILAASTADRVTTSPVEGAGCERLILRTNGAAAVIIRFLSGGAAPANNTPIITSDDPDGWLGCYLKTTNSGWNVQFWLEGTTVGNNGSIPKDLIADGQWHLYEWNLDNFTGDADGWGSVAGIASGTSTVTNGSHTIDSIIFRNTTPLADATNVIFLDYIARNDAGSVADLLADPCVNTTGVLVVGPVATNSNQVTVSGVSASATEIKVYQNSGGGGAMVLVGSKNTGLTAGNNTVTVSGLVKAAQVVATQTVSGQESCVPAAANGIMVGGGANPSVRVALSIRETPSTGPIGSPGDSSYTNIHFLNATAVSSGAPINADVVYPSNDWQTVTFFRGTNVDVGDPANATGTPVDGIGYNANEYVSIQVYAYRFIPNNNVTVFSATPTTSTDVTSNDVFTVNWSWDAVAGADGYRVLRSLNFAGYTEGQDLIGTSLNDANTGWTTNATVTPTNSQTGRSVKWNATTGDPYPVGTTNRIPGQWGIVEAISFAIHNLDETGPYDLYIDTLQNGTTVFQTFENAPAKTTDYGFRAPDFSGTTGGNILTSPNVGQVANNVADTGTKSFHVRFQWSGTNTTKWLRLTTSGVNNPQVNLDQPISFRLLLQPVNAALPTAPAAPTVTVNPLGNKTVLNWTGGHRLQTSVAVTGTYTNVPQVLSANTWTNVSQGAFLGPWTNTYTEPNRFFRLLD